jgi:hypothetical protein
VNNYHRKEMMYIGRKLTKSIATSNNNSFTNHTPPKMLSKVISRGGFKEMFLLCITFIKPMTSIVILSQLCKLSLTKFHSNLLFL